MNTKLLIAVLVALVVGSGAGYAVASSKTPQGHVMPGGGATAASEYDGMQANMSGMMAGLTGKTGDDFDKAFLAEMTTHHEGAVMMAEAALQNARHTELKEMAKAIISAQTSEIQQMKAWRANWYGSESE